MCEFDYSMFLAKVLGLYLFLTSLAFLLNQQRFKKIFHDLVSDHAMLTVTGCVGMFIGLLIVLSHNIWMSDWPVMVTIVGWVALLQGIARIYFPDGYTKWVKESLHKSGFQIWNWIWLLVGIYLIWAGFSQHG